MHIFHWENSSGKTQRSHPWFADRVIRWLLEQLCSREGDHPENNWVSDFGVCWQGQLFDSFYENISSILWALGTALHTEPESIIWFIFLESEAVILEIYDRVLYCGEEKSWSVWDFEVPLFWERKWDIYFKHWWVWQIWAMEEIRRYSQIHQTVFLSSFWLYEQQQLPLDQDLLLGNGSIITSQTAFQGINERTLLISPPQCPSQTLKKIQASNISPRLWKNLRKWVAHLHDFHQRNRIVQEIHYSIAPTKQRL